jgi:hypothetical protein
LFSWFCGLVTSPWRLAGRGGAIQHFPPLFRKDIQAIAGHFWFMNCHTFFLLCLKDSSGGKRTRHPCLEWNSNPRSQRSSGRRQLTP